MIILRQKAFAGEFQEALKNRPNAIQKVAPGQLGTSTAALQTRSKEQFQKSAETFQKLSKTGGAAKLNDALGTKAVNVKSNVNNMMNNQRLTTSNQNFKNGLNSATVNKTTLMNTWNNMGTAGKVGTVAGAAALGGLAIAGAKNLLSRKKKDEEK